MMQVAYIGGVALLARGTLHPPPSLSFVVRPAAEPEEKLDVTPVFTGRNFRCHGPPRPPWWLGITRSMRFKKAEPHAEPWRPLGVPRSFETSKRWCETDDNHE